MAALAAAAVDLVVAAVPVADVVAPVVAVPAVAVGLTECLFENSRKVRASA